MVIIPNPKYCFCVKRSPSIIPIIIVQMFDIPSQFAFTKVNEPFFRKPKSSWANIKYAP